MRLVTPLTYPGRLYAPHVPLPYPGRLYAPHVHLSHTQGGSMRLMSPIPQGGYRVGIYPCTHTSGRLSWWVYTHCTHLREATLVVYTLYTPQGDYPGGIYLITHLREATLVVYPVIYAGRLPWWYTLLYTQGGIYRVLYPQ